MRLLLVQVILALRQIQKNLGLNSINDDTHDQDPHDLSLVSINHDQIDRDGDIYEEEDIEDERVVGEERDNV